LTPPTPAAQRPAITFPSVSEIGPSLLKDLLTWQHRVAPHLRLAMLDHGQLEFDVAAIAKALRSSVSNCRSSVRSWSLVLAHVVRLTDCPFDPLGPDGSQQLRLIPKAVDRFSPFVEPRDLRVRGSGERVARQAASGDRTVVVPLWRKALYAS
jgi:hypothetical protein